MKLSIVIPTAGRPHYLRTALESVANQTARREIGEVLVSENLGDRRSEDVCAGFPGLPIRYTFRDPQLGHPRHAGVVCREARGELIALLNDDDWWAPGHLATAIDSLDRHPDCVAWHSTSLWLADEAATECHLHRHGILWFAAGKPPSHLAEWIHTKESILPLCWVYAPFHWSTMVARRDPLHASVVEFDHTHAWNADRLLPIRLASHGNLVFQPLSQAYVRLHEDTWASDPTKRAQLEAADATWKESVRRIAEEEECDLPAAWRRILEDLPESERAYPGRLFRRHFKDDELRAMGLDAFVQPASGATLQRLRAAAHWLLPRGIGEAVSRARQQRA